MALAPCCSIADPVNATATAGASTASENKGGIVDPKAHGAMGDGVTDDSAAFTSVVAPATAVRGTAQIPARPYLTTIAVTKGGITIQGAGKDATYSAPNTTAASAAGHILAMANSDSTTIDQLPSGCLQCDAANPYFRQRRQRNRRNR